MAKHRPTEYRFTFSGDLDKAAEARHTGRSLLRMLMRAADFQGNKQRVWKKTIDGVTYTAKKRFNLWHLHIDAPGVNCAPLILAFIDLMVDDPIEYFTWNPRTPAVYTEVTTFPNSDNYLIYKTNDELFWAVLQPNRAGTPYLRSPDGAFAIQLPPNMGHCIAGPIGTPYHGKVQPTKPGGALTLEYDGTVHPYTRQGTATLKPYNTNLLLAQGDKISTINTTPWDDDEKWVWKDRHLMSLNTNPTGDIVWQDAGGQFWDVDIDLEVSGVNIRAEVAIRDRYGYTAFVDTCNHSPNPTFYTPWLDVGTELAAGGFGTPVEPTTFKNQNPRGDRTLLGIRGNQSPEGSLAYHSVAMIVEVSLTGTLDCATQTGPVASIKIDKDTQECSPPADVRDIFPTNVYLGDSTRSITTCSVSSTCGTGGSLQTMTKTLTKTSAATRYVGEGAVPASAGTDYGDMKRTADEVWGLDRTHIGMLLAFYDETGASHYIVDKLAVTVTNDDSILNYNYDITETNVTVYTPVTTCVGGTFANTYTLTKDINLKINANWDYLETRQILVDGAVATTATCTADWNRDLEYDDDTGSGPTNSNGNFSGEQVCNVGDSTVEGVLGDTGLLPYSETEYSNTAEIIADGVTLWTGTANQAAGGQGFPQGYIARCPEPTLVGERIAGFKTDSYGVGDSEYWIGPVTDVDKITGWAKKYVAFNPFDQQLHDDEDYLINFV